MKMICLIVGLLFPMEALSVSDKVAEYISQAQAAMNDGEFAKASEYYESALFSGHQNGHVFYNYGISLFRQGEIGTSVAAFLAAKRFLPRNPDIKANLSYSHSLAKDDLDYSFAETKPTFAKPFFWVDGLSRVEQFHICFVLFILIGVFFAAYQFSVFQHLCVWAGLSCSAVLLVFSIGLFVDFRVNKPIGAVHVDSLKAYSGPSDKGNSIVFELSEGAPVQLLESDDQWAKVSLSDGKKGWVRSSLIRVY